MKKKEKDEIAFDEHKWEVEEAMETLKRYAKLVEDKKLKEEAIAKLESEAKKYSKIAEELK